MRTIEGNAAVTVIHKRLTDKLQIIVPCDIVLADGSLESGLSRGDYPNYIFFECVNYPLSICSDGRQ